MKLENKLLNIFKTIKDLFLKKLNMENQINAIQRTVLTLLMILPFIFLSLKEQIYMIFLTIAITSRMTYEIIALTRFFKSKIGFRSLLSGYMAVIIFLYNNTMILTYKSIFSCINISYNKLKLILFWLYSIGFCLYIINLRKGMLKRQLMSFACLHLVSYALGACCYFAIRNILVGKFYFFFPALLVITNDIFAYIVGKTIGKTPLYELSPKKTVEGFYGAFICTSIIGFLLCYLKVTYNLLPDQLDKYMLSLCDIGLAGIKCKYIYLHAIPFILFASFGSPFCGFLASAFKRACKRKDFGNILPGHGGITDRMDCQVFMVCFTFFYLKACLIGKEKTVNDIYNYVTNNFTQEEIKDLIFKLKSTLK